MTTAAEQDHTTKTTESSPEHGTPIAVEREFTVKARTQREQIVRRFLHNKQALTGLFVFALLFLVAWIGPFFYGFRWDQISPGDESLGPGT
nr:hypothetical protein [Geodermatophilaceae bacterium]